MSGKVTNFPHAQAESADVEKLRMAINTVDAMSRGMCASIAALVHAALDCLDFDVNKLERARQFLLLIEEKAADLDNAINWQAEQVGQNYIDEAGRERTRALWKKHHAFNDALRAPSKGA